MSWKLVKDCFTRSAMAARFGVNMTDREREKRELFAAMYGGGIQRTLVPSAVRCVTCYNKVHEDGVFESHCPDCQSTGREPIPWTEVNFGLD